MIDTTPKYTINLDRLIGMPVYTTDILDPVGTVRNGFIQGTQTIILVYLDVSIKWGYFSCVWDIRRKGHPSRIVVKECDDIACEESFKRINIWERAIT